MFGRAYCRKDICVRDLGGLFSGGLILGGGYDRNFTLEQNNTIHQYCIIHFFIKAAQESSPTWHGNKRLSVHLAFHQPESNSRPQFFLESYEERD